MSKNLVASGIILFCLWLGVASTTGSMESQLIDRTDSGAINWSRGFVEAKGVYKQKETASGNIAAREFAIREATKIASRNLLKTLRGVRIDTDSKISDLMANDEKAASDIKGFLKEAQFASPKFLSDGTVEINAKMNIYGEFAQRILPSDIKRIEAIQPIMPENTLDEPVDKSPEDKNRATESYTGMVIDARSICLKPALAPKIVDENGEEIFGSAFVSREFAIQGGITGYATDLTGALKDPRVKDRPLTFKGLKSVGFGHCDIVISTADAGRLKSNFNHLLFLKKCRVIIVLDPI
jgi:hypothetical protein